MKYLLILSIVLAGCSNKFDECVDKQKEEYRSSHSNASYSLINSKQKDFELMCSKFKDK